MEKVSVDIVISGKSLNTEYCSGAFHTNSPKFFLKYYELNDPIEYGICTKTKATSLVEEEKNTEDKSYEYFPMEGEVSETVRNYKKIVQMVDLNEIEQIRLRKSIFEIAKEELFEFDKGVAACFGLMWLFSNNDSLWYAAYVLMLYLLCSMNVFEAYRLVKSLLGSEEKKEQLDNELRAIGLSDIIQNVETRDEVKLYFKINGEFNFKK